jgi:hypothetical protein
MKRVPEKVNTNGRKKKFKCSMFLKTLNIIGNTKINLGSHTGILKYFETPLHTPPNTF